MRRIMTLLLPLALMLPVSCSKEPAQRDQPQGDEMHTVTLYISSGGSAETKARNTSTLPLTDGIQTLDLFVFHEKEPDLDYHVSLTPDPSGVTEYALREKTTERVGIIAAANLHEDTVELLASHTLEDYANEWEMPCPIVWTADNFDFDRIPMVGARDVYFWSNNNNTAEIELRRIMWRIDIGSIVYAPNDPAMRGKDVFVKNIALTNISNHFNFTKSESIGHFYTWYLFFGNDTNLTDAFGGIETGFRFFNNYPKDWSPSGSWNPGGPGILDNTYPRTINDNYKKAKGVLNIDATGKYLEATCQSYNTASGQGRLAYSGVTTDQTMAVGKSLYGFLGNGCFSNYSNECTYDKQQYFPKLVVELVIDGKSRFYPMCLNFPQPNTVYKVDKLTIVGDGSNYSNFVEKRENATYTISVAGWNELDVDNIDMGWQDYAGTTTY